VLYSAKKKRELLITKYLNKRIELKNNLKRATSCEAKLEISCYLQNLPKNSSPTRSRNRCWATKRARGYYSDFGLSRHALRKMALEGLIPGLKKAS
jgi:small subunit ribosomal protein S14